MEDDTVANLDAQAKLYGDPLGVLLKRYGTALGLTQARLADLLGVSAPMLSQLVNGRRVRFGNPVTVQRLQAMDAAVRDVESGEAGVGDAIDRLERNRASDVFTTTRSMDEPGLAVVRRVFAAAASPEEYAAAAAAIRTAHPRIAALLDAYGAGSESTARAEFAAGA